MPTTLLLLGALVPFPLPSPFPQSPVAPAVTATNRFGLELERALAARQPTQNLFVSPWSLATALTMVAEGARGETAEEMGKVLHLPASLEAAHLAFAALAHQIEVGSGAADTATRQRIAGLREQIAAVNRELEAAPDGQITAALTGLLRREADLVHDLNRLLPLVDRYEVRAANALWADRTQQVLPDFVAVLDRHYGNGGVSLLDMIGDPEGSRGCINRWVEQRTGQRIRGLVPPGGIDATTRLVVGNAVYFRGEWSTPFAAGDTRDEDFTFADGRSARVATMNADFGGIRYAAFDGLGNLFATPQFVARDAKLAVPDYPGDDGFALVELPYKGGNLAMTLLAPRSPAGLPHLERLSTAKALGLWLGRAEAREVRVALPRLRLESSFELSGVLQDLGMRRAFADPRGTAGADFSGIAAEQDPARKLRIGAVLHKAWVAVDEKGTEAAAATAAMMACGAAIPEQVPFVPVFRADRPFLFFIRDTASGAILFVGRVVDPR